MRWVRVEGWLLVERERGCGGKDILVVCPLQVLTDPCHLFWPCLIDLTCVKEGKLVSKTHSVRDMVRARTDLVYINPTPSSISSGTPPHIINKVLIW